MVIGPPQIGNSAGYLGVVDLVPYAPRVVDFSPAHRCDASKESTRGYAPWAPRGKGLRNCLVNKPCLSAVTANQF